MKNKIKILYLILYFFFFSTNIYSLDKFSYEAKELEILDNGNIIRGSNDVKIVIGDHINISANKLEYNKSNELIKLSGNVKLENKEDKINLSTNEIFYSRNKDKLFSKSKTNFIFNNKYFADSKNFNYFISKEQVTSKDIVNISDKQGNFFFIDGFKYKGKEQIFKGLNTRYVDKEKNEYLISNTIINLKNNHILGKDLSINFNKSTFGNNENDPRLKSASFYVKDNITSMNRGVFTTCKKNDKCPPWKIYAENIEHDKEKEIITYKNAWLKVYNMPIAYFPKFSHPDPTVRRKSGFLAPSFINSNLHGLSLDLPYYMVISENKDLTFKPRLYANDQAILQNEYRQINKNSEHIFDLSFNSSGILGSNKQTKSHFFSKSIFDLKLNNFENSNFELNLEKTTNDTYLKTYKIKSPLIDDNSLLNSYLVFNAENRGLSISSSIEVWEDLSKNPNDRYEFVYPNYKILKQLDTKENNLTFSSYGYQKKYQTNIYEGIITNDFLYQTNSNISEWGLKSNFNALLKNVNIDSENSSKYKDGMDQSLLSSFMFSSEFPLKKNNNSLTPKFSLMYSPNKTKNMVKENKRIDVNNIYSFNRIGVSDTVEGGASITLGTEYKKTNINNYQDLISLNLATVIRNEKNEDLPEISSLGDTHSDFFGNLKIEPNKYFDLNYNFAIDNSFNKTNFDAIKTNFSINNFITSFEYIDDKEGNDQQSYITNNTSLKVDDSSSLGFNIRKNKKTNATEFYDLFYSYSNDCLEAAISFNKSYYSDSDLKPEKQLFFTLTIIPFGQINSPNLNN